MSNTWNRSALIASLAAILVLTSSVNGQTTKQAGVLRNPFAAAIDRTREIRRLAGDQVELKADPRFGRVADFNESGPGILQLDRPLRTEQGTISFWVRPDWDSDSKESHTLMTAAWNDPRNSYLAISDGWWEPTGARRLYFIVSNEDFVHCSSDIRLLSHAWSLITAVWVGGESGVCKLFVDDELRAESKHSLPAGKSTDILYVGTDKAASVRKGRLGRASIYGLKIFGYSSTHREVIERYQSEETSEALNQKKWAWFDKTIGAPVGRAAPQREVKRAIFDEDMGWAISREAIDERLERIERAGFNIYVPCVWHGRGALYPSTVAWPDDRLRHRFLFGWDPLAYLVQEAHARGIAVYPWFTVVRREDEQHPEWAATGVPDNAYNVHQPEFRAFISDLILDVVRRYDIDGINLDYIRAMGVCISAQCKQSYLSATGAELAVDHANIAKDPKARSRLQAWQDAAIADIVKRVSINSKSIKAGLVVSVDGHAVTSELDRPLEGRNEIDWANRGWVDGIFHMDYRTKLDIEGVVAARKALRDPQKLWLLVANYDLTDERPVPRLGKWLRSLVLFTENNALGDTIGVYLYGQLSDEQLYALANHAGKEGVQSPLPKNSLSAADSEQRSKT